MTHEILFQGIPMSKSMRGMCKEEDYSFLATSGETTKGTSEEVQTVQGDWRHKKGDRDRRQLEREQQEKERLREVEASKKEKEQQWRSHVAEMSSNQENSLQDRLARLRKFREFQRKVLVEESGMESKAVSHIVNQLLTRM